MGSTGAIFNLLANDGKADRLILASDLLKARIRNIMCARAKNGMPDPTPTLLDLEKTHILFVNAHYKPFAAMAYEYMKVPGNRGAAFGQSTQYSIPQFGDFFHDMVLNVRLDQTQATLSTLQDFSGVPTIGTLVSTTTTAKTSHVENATDGVYTRYTYEYVTKDGTVLTVGDALRNYVRYCEYPGERFIKKCKFDVNANPLDEYDSNSAVFARKFKIAPHKLTGYKRLVGQEIEKDAVSDLLVVEGSSNYDPEASDLVGAGSVPALVAPTSSDVTARRVSKIVSGPQTPKAVQPELEMWVPLRFWFNTDVRLAVPSVSIPYGQRFITIDVEEQNKLLYAAAGNVYLRLTTDILVDDGTTGTGTAAAINVESNKRIVTMEPVLVSGSVIDTTQQIRTMDLYINNIFVNPEIHDIYIKRIGFSLIRVHRQQKTRLSTAQDKIQLTQLKWPVEYFFAGIKPIVNESSTNPNQHRDWHRFTANSDAVLDVNSTSTFKFTGGTVTYASVLGATYRNQVSSERMVMPIETPTLDSVKIEVHGITAYQELKTAFYRDYLPYTYGGINIVTPDDEGVVLINFCLYPTQYQPSGHINISRAREFFFGYSSSYVGSTTQADLIIDASAINFLLISDGSAVLRYST